MSDPAARQQAEFIMGRVAVNQSIELSMWNHLVDKIESAILNEREACAKLLDVSAAEKLKANNRDATMALMQGANTIRARGTR